MFEIQPILGKILLPRFGGAAAVWTLCLVFFETLLLAGYLYAHYTKPWAHTALLLSSLLFLPAMTVTPQSTNPDAIFFGLLAMAGAPYFLLASTSPLLQKWSGERDPYRLYAISNAGSLIALVSYPFAVEPWLPLRTQIFIWRLFYIIFAAACAVISWRVAPPAPERSEPVPKSRLVFWAGCAAVGSGLLAATTNEICQDVASLPFLWILPLALYLATFAITFAWEASYRSGTWASLASVAIPVACAVWVLGAKTPVWVRIFIDFAALAVCLMLVHGELARSRPKPAALTQFYIAIGAGGALGGLFVAVIAPLIFHSYIEFPILIALSGAMWLIGRCCDGEFGWRSMPPLARTSATGFAFAVLAPWILFDSRTGAVLAQTRNFYGTLRVTEWKDNGGHRRVLTHGAITHGSQFLDEPLRTTPTTYYGRNSGAGLTLESHRRAKGGPLRVGVIGLGAGTLAQYSLPGDVFRFYEINPEVIRLAKDHFTFLTDASGAVEIVLGDARLEMQREPPQAYDLLQVDAFSSDSIPVHLLTLECAELYKSHLAPDGELLIHITNRTLDLEPVVRGLARHIGFSAIRIDSPADTSRGASAASWMRLAPGENSQSNSRVVVWSDDFASLWPLLKTH